jgi:hypothetical protein
MEPSREARREATKETSREARREATMEARRREDKVTGWSFCDQISKPC